MKELLFVYDGSVASDDDGNFYAGTAFSQSVFERYLRHFDHITLIALPERKQTDLSKMNRLDRERVSVVFLPYLRGSIKDFFSLKKNREFKRIICEQITRDKAVVVRLPSTSGSIAAKYCKKICKPFLAEIVGCPWDSYRNHSFRGKILAPFEFLRQRRAVKKASHVVYVTDSFLQKRYPARGVTAAISDVELQSIDDCVIEKRMKKISETGGKLLVGTAAAVDVPYKGQRYVIEAIAKCNARGKNGIEYHLAGGGDRTELENLARSLGVADCIVFDGTLPHDEMFCWMDRMDLYIQPSTVEAMPRALIEAMSRGLPAFASRVGGMPELVGMSSVFEKRDTEAICDMICRLDSASMKAMAERNFNYAKNFRKDILEKKRNDFYGDFAKVSMERKK